MSENLKFLDNIASAVSMLFFPHVEAVIHDIKTDKIVAIHNSFSRRNVGDPSLLDISEIPEPDGILGPYQKNNPDGSLSKCISVAIGSSKKPSYLLCLNFNLTPLEKVLRSISELMASETKMPDSLFARDWKEQIHDYIFSFARSGNKPVASLTRDDKQMLIQDLKNKGFLEAPRSYEYLAEILNISRATVFNYLRRSDRVRK